MMDFSKALEALKAGKKVKRSVMKDGTYLIIQNIEHREEHIIWFFDPNNKPLVPFYFCDDDILADDWEIVKDTLDFNTAFEALNNGNKIWQPGMSEDTFLYLHKNVIFMRLVGKGSKSYRFQYDDIISKDWIVKEDTDDEIYTNVCIIYECPECHRRYSFSTSFGKMKNEKTMTGCVCGKPFSIVHFNELLDSPFSKKFISEYRRWLETSISYWETQIQIDDIPTQDKCENLNKLIDEQNLMIENGL